MAQLNQIFVIIVFAYAARFLLNQLAEKFGLRGIPEIDSAIAICFYFTILFLTIFVLKLKALQIRKIAGSSFDMRLVYEAIGAGIVFYGFTRGQNALEVMAVARLSPELAYDFWDFYPSADSGPPLLSLTTIVPFIRTSLVAPVVEEFVFRGLLLPILARRYRYLTASVIVTAIFTVAHVKNEYIISCILFSLYLNSLYAAKKSLALCVIMHGVYNAIEFSIRNFCDTHLIRPISQISQFSHWIPELTMWACSLFVIILYCYKARMASIK